MNTSIFVNIPVKDLTASMDFFTKLGFTFNPQFTNEKGACMVVEENKIYYMLLTEDMFKKFTNKTIVDGNLGIQTIHCIGVESRAKVDEIFNAAIAAGATEARPAEDHGWMYLHSLYDINGYMWEFAYMDSSAIPAA